jgi:hypothetical protein
VQRTRTRNRRICDHQDRHRPRQHGPNRNGEHVATWVYDMASRRSDAEFELINLRDYSVPHPNSMSHCRRYLAPDQHAHTRP